MPRSELVGALLDAELGCRLTTPHDVELGGTKLHGASPEIRTMSTTNVETLAPALTGMSYLMEEVNDHQGGASPTAFAKDVIRRTEAFKENLSLNGMACVCGGAEARDDEHEGGDDYTRDLGLVEDDTFDVDVIEEQPLEPEGHSPSTSVLESETQSIHKLYEYDDNLLGEGAEESVGQAPAQLLSQPEHRLTIDLLPGPLGLGIQKHETSGQCVVYAKRSSSSSSSAEHFPLQMQDVILSLNGVTLADVPGAGVETWVKMFASLAEGTRTVVVLRPALIVNTTPIERSYNISMERCRKQVGANHRNNNDSSNPEKQNSILQTIAQDFTPAGDQKILRAVGRTATVNAAILLTPVTGGAACAVGYITGGAITATRLTGGLHRRDEAEVAKSLAVYGAATGASVVGQALAGAVMLGAVGASLPVAGVVAFGVGCCSGVTAGALSEWTVDGVMERMRGTGGDKGQVGDSVALE